MTRRPEGGIGESWLNRTGVLFVGGALMLSACSGGANQSKETGVTGTPTAAPTSSSSAVKERQNLVFDYLGGGSRSVFVYPGVTTEPEDKVPLKAPVYTDGDVVVAECKLTGRLVSSHPELGETDRTSDQWIRVHSDTPGVAQYATAVYVENYKDLLARLDVC